MDLLSKMATYVRVVESGSLSAAAKQLRISSAAVSRQISTLEGELRVSLLSRTTRKMALTEPGRRYYERCTRILREVEEAQALGQHGGLEGPVKMTAPVTFGLAVVAPLMHGLMKRHPGLLLELNLEDRLVDLMPEGFDVAIRVGSAPPESADLIATELVQYSRVLVASPRYLKKHGSPGSPESLAKHDALMPVTGNTESWTLWSGEAEARVRPRVVFRSNALHALRELAVQGAGIALIPKWLAKEAIAARQLRVILPAWRPRRTRATAIYRKEHRGAARVRALLDHLRDGVKRLGESEEDLRAR